MVTLQKPIEDESFRIERDIDASILLAREVRGLADAPAKLKELGVIDDDTLSVITLLEIGPDGQILLARVGVTGPKNSQKVLASKLFCEAPETARLRMKIDYSCFNFAPGCTTSEWVSSDDIQWSLMKTNNQHDGVHDQSTYKDVNVCSWSCRLVVTPTAESHVASVELVAIPRPVAELGALPGVASGEGSAAYPVITLGVIRAAMAGVLEQPRHDGLGFYPVVVNRGPAGGLLAAPDSNSVRVAMRSIWSNNVEANSLTSRAWVEATRGPGEPDQSPIEAEFAWPQVVANVDDDEDSGKFYYKQSVLSSSIFYHQNRINPYI